ncbi:hypothetical protein [Allochromatium palmeri]|uniref:Uncharacterized protein n=1 Tax=Allochromatium palmeri TaxID=231048 RepID=A0A6N8EFU1_9GAMM|nr:hypothetical protein [Allochromatium palmeri]MTW23182.1 hypothetical protein [Allochromatium palmeri]
MRVYLASLDNPTTRDEIERRLQKDARPILKDNRVTQAIERLCARHGLECWEQELQGLLDTASMISLGSSPSATTRSAHLGPRHRHRWSADWPTVGMRT